MNGRLSEFLSPSLGRIRIFGTLEFSFLFPKSNCGSFKKFITKPELKSISWFCGGDIGCVGRTLCDVTVSFGIVGKNVSLSFCIGFFGTRFFKPLMTLVITLALPLALFVAFLIFFPMFSKFLFKLCTVSSMMLFPFSLRPSPAISWSAISTILSLWLRR